MKRDNSSNGSEDPPQKFPKPATDTSNVVIRFLIPCRAAGIMIGKGGENINRIRNKFNVKLHIPDNRGPERVMTIEGDLNSICDVLREVSPKLKDIINAKLSDPRRIMGNYVPRRQEEPEREDENIMLDYRIMVHESQAGSVIGRGGERIKELRLKYRMRVIKVYQLLAPMSTDRVVQMVADPDNVISCIKSVVEAVESAPPRGRREDYDAANFCEAEALNYGGWLSPDGVRALAQGMPLPRSGPPMGYMDPYMGGNMGMGGPPGHMGPMHGPMGGHRGPPPGVRGPRPGGNVPQRPMGGPTPVPPPRAGIRGPTPAYGNGSQYDGQAGMQGYDSGYDVTASYTGVDANAQSGYGAPGSYGTPAPVAPAADTYAAAPGYGQAQRPATGMAQTAPARGAAYGGYGVANVGGQDEQKAAQWYGGWA